MHHMIFFFNLGCDQMHPRGRNIRYSQGRGVSGGDVPPYDMGNNNNNITMPIGALASNLANASPEQQRTVRDSLKKTNREFCVCRTLMCVCVCVYADAG